MQKKLFVTLVCILMSVSLFVLCSCEGLLPDIKIDDKSYNNKPMEEIKGKLGDNYAITVNIIDADGNVQESVLKVTADATYISEKEQDATVATIRLVKDGKEYLYNASDDKYYFDHNVSGERLSDGVKAMMIISGMSSIAYSKEESGKVVGRNVTVYVSINSFSGFGVQAGAEIKYYVDDETGLCLKTEGGVKVSAIGEGSESGDASFETTYFKIGGVNLASEIAKIDESGQQGGNDNPDISGGNDNPDISGGNDNPDISGGNDNPDIHGGDDQPEDTTKKLTTQKAVLDYLGNNYSITWYVSQPGNYGGQITGTILVKRVDDKFYVEANLTQDDNTVKSLMILDGDISYNYDSDSGKITTCQKLDQSQKNDVLNQMYSLGAISELVSYSDYKGYDKSTLTVAGIQCANYVDDIDLYGISNHYEYAVDEQTGLRLRLYSATTQSKNATSIVIEYKVTAIKVGGVTMGNEMDVVKIASWPTASVFALLGAPSLTAPTGDFYGYELRYTEEGNLYRYDAYYFFDSFNEAKAYATALYAGGVNIAEEYDEESGEYVMREVEFTQLFEEDGQWCRYRASYSNNYYDYAEMYVEEYDDVYRLALVVEKSVEY